jgi:L-lactate dehydrogenase complex protein LldE
MRVALFVTCLVDQLWPAVGHATVRVLRRAGCEVAFDPRQTCCGQPAFNSGYCGDARNVARALLQQMDTSDAEALVIPSGSCTAMVKHLPELFASEPHWRERAEWLAAKTWELSAFLIHVLEQDDFGAEFEGRVSWHDACHGLRELGLKDEPRRLLRNVKGLELIDAEACDTCCGFGGTFSVKYPEISVAMADRKLDVVQRLELDAIVSGDVSCLMQLGGRLQTLGSSVRTLHLAEVLAGTEPAS